MTRIAVLTHSSLDKSMPMLEWCAFSYEIPHFLRIFDLNLTFKGIQSLRIPASILNPTVFIMIFVVLALLTMEGWRQKETRSLTHQPDDWWRLI